MLNPGVVLDPTVFPDRWDIKGQRYTISASVVEPNMSKVSLVFTSQMGSS